MTPIPCPACGGSLTIPNGSNGSVTWCQLPHPAHDRMLTTNTTMAAAPMVTYPSWTLPNGYGSGTAR